MYEKYYNGRVTKIIGIYFNKIFVRNYIIYNNNNERQTVLKVFWVFYFATKERMKVKK